MKELYNRINRKELIADTNLVQQSQFDPIIASPVQLTDKALLYSRVGGSDRLPVSGYCLQFNATNSTTYIQTSIASSERDSYNITIKGEGTYSLYVDSSGANIAIRQLTTPAGGDYFNLSYIAFSNSVGGIVHLFECEESSGTVLYDAVSGATATLESVVSLSALRVSATSKEWIRDISNLDNVVHFNNGRAQTALVNSFPIFSMCATMTMTQAEFDSMPNFTNFFGYPAGSNYNMLYKNGENIVWVLYDTINNKYLPLRSPQKTLLLNGSPHKIALIGNNNLLKLSIDGTVSTQSTTINVSGYPTTYSQPFMVGIASNLKGKFSNVKFFNFDISASGAPYTVSDYQNNKDVSSALLLGSGTDKAILSLNNVSNTFWLDSSINKYNAALSGTFTLPNKEYGTWCNAVGYTASSGVNIPRKVL